LLTRDLFLTHFFSVIQIVRHGLGRRRIGGRLGDRGLLGDEFQTEADLFRSRQALINPLVQKLDSSGVIAAIVEVIQRN
jgi:hypothetical protein